MYFAIIHKDKIDEFIQRESKVQLILKIYNSNYINFDINIDFDGENNN